MLADFATFGSFDVAWLRRQVSREKLCERALADEADAGTVLLVEHGESELARRAAHVALLHRADWKQCACERLGRHRVQEVALILAGIHPAKQSRARAMLDPLVVARSDP